jgi:hypothetical protein
MTTSRSLRYMILWNSRMPGRHRREPPPKAVRTHATRGIVVPALVLASLGSAAGVTAVQSAGSHANAGAHPSAESLARQSNTPWIW